MIEQTLDSREVAKMVNTIEHNKLEMKTQQWNYQFRSISIYTIKFIRIASEKVVEKVGMMKIERSVTG